MTTYGKIVLVLMTVIALFGFTFCKAQDTTSQTTTIRDVFVSDIKLGLQWIEDRATTSQFNALYGKKYGKRYRS